MILLTSGNFFFSKLIFQLILSGSLTVSNSFDSDQYRSSVGPVLGPNCLQSLSEDEKSHC